MLVEIKGVPAVVHSPRISLNLFENSHSHRPVDLAVSAARQSSDKGSDIRGPVVRLVWHAFKDATLWGLNLEMATEIRRMVISCLGSMGQTEAEQDR